MLTGGREGLGLATAKRYAVAGAKVRGSVGEQCVAGVDRRSPTREARGGNSRAGGALVLLHW